MIYEKDFKPYPFQVKGVQRLTELGGRCLLGDEMGLGKTIQAVMFMKQHSALPCVICCPAAVKHNWESEVYRLTQIRSYVANGRTPPPIKELREQKVFIVNYDILGQKKVRRTWAQVLSQLGPKLVVLDECHSLINRKTNRTTHAKKLTRQAEFVLALSGTALVNRPVELWPILNMLRPDLYPSFFTFGQRYCGATYTAIRGWEYKGATRQVELNRKLKKNIMVRRLLKDVVSELPPPQRFMHFVEMEDRSEYEEAEANFASWLTKQNPAKAKKAKKAMALVRLGVLTRLVAKKKLKSVVTWINNWLEANPTEKLVVFAHHKKVISVLERRINSRVVKIVGGMSTTQRRIAVEQFRKTKSTRVFLGNLKAAGTGLNGLQVASSMAIVELPLRPGDVVQAEARINRIGQLGTSKIHYLLTESTVEEDMCELLHKKHNVVKSILDGEEHDDDFDLMQLLFSKLAERKLGASTRVSRKTRR